MDISITVPTSLPSAPWRVAAKQWGEQHAKKCLAVHGRLDNAASFDRLAPILSDLCSLHVVAIDLPGHGQTACYSDGCYPVSSLGMLVTRCVHVLAWEGSSCILLAHSFGCAVGLVAAAAEPGLFERVLFLDSMGEFGLTWAVDNMTGTRLDLSAGLLPLLASAASNMKRVDARAGSTPKVYDGIDQMVQARLKAVRENTKGTHDIQPENARLIVQRGSLPAGGGYCFSHDVRVNIGPSLQLITQEHAIQLLNVLPPTLVLLAEFGYPATASAAEVLHARLCKTAQQSINLFRLCGTYHHFHMDEAEWVSEIVACWLHAPTNVATSHGGTENTTVHSQILQHSELPLFNGPSKL